MPYSTIFPLTSSIRARVLLKYYRNDRYRQATEFLAKKSDNCGESKDILSILVEYGVKYRSLVDKLDNFLKR